MIYLRNLQALILRLSVNLTVLMMVMLLPTNKSIADDAPAHNPKMIVLNNLWIRPAPEGLNMATLYCSFENKGDQVDYFLTVTSEMADFLDVQKTIIENDVATVIGVRKIAIPAKMNVDFSPGGIHVVLMGLHKILKNGDTVKLKFYFQNQGTIEAVALVKDN